MLRRRRRRCRFAHITVARPVVSMLPCAEGSRQGVVGSVLVLLGSICLAAWLCFLLDLSLVIQTRLVEGGPDLVILGLLRPGLHVGSAVAREVIGGVEVVWPVAAVASCVGAVGISRSRASLSVGTSRPRALTCIRLQWSNIRSSPVAVPPRDDVSDPPEDKDISLTNDCVLVITSQHRTECSYLSSV